MCPFFPVETNGDCIDLQSFRFQSDRIAKADYLKNGTVINMKPDKDRSGQPYYYYTDNNGKYYHSDDRSIDPNWQGDYGRVRFSLYRRITRPFEEKDLYLLGEFTGYKINDVEPYGFQSIQWCL